MPRGRRKGPPKPKVLTVELIDPNMKPALQPYKILAEVRKEVHQDTLEAKVALAWRRNVKADPDGHLMLGMCVKASDLQRELVNWDFVILLNKDVWDDKEFTEDKKKALIDHEMCHVGDRVDKNGEPVTDAKGRKMWRIVTHDIEEFHAVVRRHGTYKKDLERFAESLLRKSNPTLFDTQSQSAPAQPTIQ